MSTASNEAAKPGANNDNDAPGEETTPIRIRLNRCVTFQEEDVVGLPESLKSMIIPMKETALVSTGDKILKTVVVGSTLSEYLSDIREQIEEEAEENADSKYLGIIRQILDLAEKSHENTIKSLKQTHDREITEYKAKLAAADAKSEHWQTHYNEEFSAHCDTEMKRSNALWEVEGLQEKIESLEEIIEDEKILQAAKCPLCTETKVKKERFAPFCKECADEFVAKGTCYCKATIKDVWPVDLGK
ncbi:MAG: hypothetical protein SGARI_003967 [Bacillariaceae sp.]